MNNNWWEQTPLPAGIVAITAPLEVPYNGKVYRYWLALADLAQFDMSRKRQRITVKAFVKRISGPEFDPRCVRVTLTRRSDGVFSRSGGGHCGDAAKAAGIGHICPVLIVETDPTVDEARDETTVYRKLNDHYGHSAAHKLKVALEEGDPNAVALVEMLHEAGYTFNPDGSEWTDIKTPAGLNERVGAYGLQAVKEALLFARQTWPNQPVGQKAALISGLVWLLLRYRTTTGKFPEERLQQTLGVLVPDDIVRTVAGLAKSKKETAYKRMAQWLADHHNRTVDTKSQRVFPQSK